MSQTELTCPHCQSAIAAELAEEPQVIRCPHCLEEITLPATEQAEPGADDLNARRIQQISRLRRSAYRSRSYWLIATILLVVAGIQMLVISINDLRRDGFQLRILIELLGWPIAGYFAALTCYRRSEQFRHYAEQSNLESPTTPPDFTTLSDGSQSWKSLEDLHNKKREPPP